MTKYCDFKIARQIETASGTEVLVYLYEGEEGPGIDKRPDGSDAEVTRYRRNKIVGEKTFLLKAGATEKQIEDAITSWANKAASAPPVPVQKAAFDRTK